MPPYLADPADRISWRIRRLAPGEFAPRSNAAAVAAVGVVLVGVLLAQLTLVLLVGLRAIGKVSRWRPLWLACPAALGLGWLLAIGLRPGLAGYLAGASHVIAALTKHGTIAARLRQLRLVVGEWQSWLPDQLPVALVLAAAVTAGIDLAQWRSGPHAHRPGGLITIRRWYLAATLRRGELATPEGCCVGIDALTGRRAVISWSEAEGGVLCTGQDQAAAAKVGRALTAAAIQHRKTVIVLDLAGAVVGAGTVDYAGEPIALIGARCAEVAAPLVRFDQRAGYYDPLTGASPARATSLIMAMVNWNGAPHGQQLLCSNYLNVALTLITAAPAGTTTLLTELTSLLAPAALTARATALRSHSEVAARLAPRIAELVAKLEVEPMALQPVAAQLGELSSVPTIGRPPVLTTGQPARASEHSPIVLADALASRAVVYFGLAWPLPAEPGAMIARLAVADLITQLAERSDRGGRADCLVWINGCEAIVARQLGALIALGTRTGTSVVLSTADGAAVASLAPQSNVIAVHGIGPAMGAEPGPPGPDRDSGVGLADPQSWLRGGRPGVLSVRVSQPRSRTMTDCRVVG